MDPPLVEVVRVDEVIRVVRVVEVARVFGVVYFIGELSDRTYRLGSVTIKTKCVKLNY